MENENGIGQRIAARRIELGMTQEELAKKMGYKSKSTINKIESGKNDVVQSNVVKFANLLDTSVAYLMGWDKDPEKVGDFHGRILTDNKLLEVIEIYYSLDQREQEIVRNFIKSLKK